MNRRCELIRTEKRPYQRDGELSVLLRNAGSNLKRMCSGQKCEMTGCRLELVRSRQERVPPTRRTALVVLKGGVPRVLGLIIIHHGRGHPSRGVMTGFQQGFSNKQLVEI